MKHLTSRQNPLVSRYRAVADGSDRTHVLVDGLHLVTDALRSGLPLTEAVVLADALPREEVSSLVDRLFAASVDVTSASAGVMDAVSPVRSASPIVALAARPAVSAAALFAPAATAAGAPAPLIVCAVDVQDPGNAGAIVRVAEAGGATGVAMAGQSADPFGWKALRGAMGSAFRLPIVAPCDAATLIADARAHGYRVVATIPRGGIAPDAAEWQAPTVLLVGGEGPGLPAAVIATADLRVSIPMAPAVESLNTAVCAALLVYEARRQRVGLAVPHRS